LLQVLARCHCLSKFRVFRLDFGENAYRLLDRLGRVTTRDCLAISEGSLYAAKVVQ
jgi:hypothetical protein